MPIRSTGCAICRRRRIKCDQARPACQRCATHGVQCPGYRQLQAGGVEIIDITLSTAVKAQHQYSKRGAAAVHLPPRAKAKAIPTTSSPTSTSPALTPFRSSTSTPSCSGTDESTLAQTWNDALLPSLLASSLRCSVQSPSLMSCQMYSTFLGLYLPTHGKLKDDAVLQEVTLQPSQDPTLMRAMMALALAAVGGASADEVMSRAAGVEYGRALSSLTKALGRPEWQPTDELLAATYLLSLCEFHDVISIKGGWHKHLRGASTMMLSRGSPQNIKTRLGLMLFSNSRHGALAADLINRKPGVFGRAAWRRVLFRSPTVDVSTYLYEHALQVSGLLERTDALDMSSSTIIDDVDDLLEDFIERELALRAWFSVWATPERSGVVTPWEKRGIDVFTTFASLVFDQTYSEAFWFPSWSVGYLCSQYWSAMLWLLTDKLELYKIRQQLDPTWQPPEDDVETELDKLADNLCMCMPYFCEPTTSSLSGQIGIFLPMHACANHFAKAEEWAKAIWLETMRQSVFNRGLIPPR